MDLKFQHRKIMKYSINYTATTKDICSAYCNSSDDSFCEPPCLTSCPSYCNNYLQSLIPSPSPITFKYHIHHKSLKFLILTASVSVATIFLALLCYVTFVKFNSRRRSSSSSPSPSPSSSEPHDHSSPAVVVDHPIWYINTIGLQPSVISTITVLKYKKSDGLVDHETECSVCLSEFQDDETLRLLPKCSHAFHISCIDSWLRSHTNCPLCRAPIVNINLEATGSSSSSPESNNENSGTTESTQDSDDESKL